MTLRHRVAVRVAARIPRHWTHSGLPPEWGIRRFCIGGVLACLLALAAACGPAAPSTDAGATASDRERAAYDAATPAAPDDATELRQAVVETYADIAYATYADALRTAAALPAPYDQAIAGDDGTPGRAAVHVAVTAFEDLAGKLHKAATVAEAVVGDAG